MAQKNISSPLLIVFLLQENNIVWYWQETAINKAAIVSSCLVSCQVCFTTQSKFMGSFFVMMEMLFKPQS